MYLNIWSSKHINNIIEWIKCVKPSSAHYCFEKEIVGHKQMNSDEYDEVA